MEWKTRKQCARERVGGAFGVVNYSTGSKREGLAKEIQGVRVEEAIEDRGWLFVEGVHGLEYMDHGICTQRTETLPSILLEGSKKKRKQTKRRPSSFHSSLPLRSFSPSVLSRLAYRCMHDVGVCSQQVGSKRFDDGTREEGEEE